MIGPLLRPDVFADLEAKRQALEAFTLASTWDQPFHEFEWAVVVEALANCNVALTGDGDLFLVYDESDLHVHTLDDVIEHTLALERIGGEHPDDRHETLIRLHRIATALRAAADRVEREAHAMSLRP